MLIPPQWQFPNAWLKRRRLAVVTFTGPDTVRLSRVRASKRATLFEGPLAELGPHARQLPRGVLRVAMLPAGRALTRSITTQATSEKIARSVLPGLLDTELPFQLEQSTYGFPLVSKSGRDFTALAIAARDQDLEQLISQLSGQGFDPHVIDHPGLALWTQALHEHPHLTKKKTPHLILHLGDEHDPHTLLALGHGKTLLTLQTLPPISANSTDSAQSAQSAHHTGDHLSHPAIQRVLDAQLDTDTPPNLLLTGPGAPAPKKRGPQPATILDRAAGHRALRPGPQRFNFRLDHPDAIASLRRRGTRATFHVLLAGLLLALGTFFWARHVDQLEEQIQAELTQRASDIAGFNVPKGRELAEARNSRTAPNDRASSAAALRPFIRPSKTATLRKLLDAAVKHDLPVERVSVESNTTSLVIQGTEAAPKLRFPNHTFRVIKDATHTHFILED